MRRHSVRCLLMGGQACVFYGAAEFSRDVDFAILAGSENLKRLQKALDELKAEVIAVPPFEESYLHLGLAVHFRDFPTEARTLQLSRAVISTAFLNDVEAIEKKLDEERLEEVSADRAYWAPLRQKLERLRRKREQE